MQKIVDGKGRCQHSNFGGEMFSFWRSISIFLAMGLSVGCDDKEASEPPPLGEYSSTTCGGTAPVITNLECENSGLEYDPDAGIDRPTFSLIADVTDEDGDLTSYSMLVDYDEEEDDEVAEDAWSFDLNSGVSGDICSITEVQLKGRIFLYGGPPECLCL